MSKTGFVCSIAVVALMVATPATGQLVNFPVLALGAGDGVTAVAAGWGRGLNDDSGKRNAIGVGVSRSMEMVSFSVAGGYVLEALGASSDGEITFAGAVAYHLPVEAVDLSLQTGIGYIKFAETTLNFPVGVSISGSTEAGSMMVRPWIMPRVQFTRTGGTASSTDTDFGGSGGVSFFTESGLGFGVAADLLIVDDGVGGSNSRLGFSAGVSYRLGG
jgi:hypothetical protein